MRITPVTDETFLQAAEVYTLSWRESHRGICSTEFLDSRDCSAYLRKRMEGLYLISDSIPVGVFRIKDGILSDLYIHPAQMGKGYGSACVEYAQKHNRELRLTVLSSNQRAIRLYEKMSFRFTGQDIPLRNGLWEREMRYTEKRND